MYVICVLLRVLMKCLIFSASCIVRMFVSDNESVMKDLVMLGVSICF